MSTPRYDVFVSYSHQDAALAERLSRRIRTYRPPRATGLPRRKLEVFRDRERLTTSADLAKSLGTTVGAAEHLVLLASPGAVQSAYVDQEVAAFLERKGESDIAVVACRGELPDNLPPSLRARMREPLYIDLRPAGRRTFRLESLRLIAALVGVEYSELRREDDQRRRRRQALAGAAAVLVAWTAWSGYLVSTTPAEAWEQLRQPETQAGTDPLMPVERIAIRRDDPAVVVWLGDNARYARDLNRVQETWEPPYEKLGDFAGRAATSFTATPDVGAAIRPLATVSLEATHGGDRVGTGELHVYGFLEKGRARFGRTFRFASVDSGRRTVMLPLTVIDDGRSVFDLEPWLAEALRPAGIDASDMTIVGVVRDHTTAAPSIRVDFVISDQRGDVKEVLDATAGPEHVVLSSSDSVATTMRERLEDLGSDDLWSELVADSAWVVYREPTRSTPLTFSRRSADLRADARAAGLDADLVAAIDPALNRGDIIIVEQLRRTVGATSVSVATLSGVWDHQEAVAIPPATHYLRPGASGRWLRITLPFETPATRVVDVMAVDPGRGAILMVSDREGVYRSVDGGATWRSVNLGESRLRDGERVRLMLAGSTVFALAAVRREPGDDPNPLFRLTRRDWIRRWRLGLAKLLSGAA